jgi:hypothetical protein
MDIHYIIDALHQTGFFPDFDGWVNFLLFLILAAGFFVIVLGSKKYRHLLEKLNDYF